MPLGNSGGPQVTEDELNASQSNDAFYNLLRVGLAGFGLYKLAKTGALKPVLAPLMETADMIAHKGINSGASAMGAVRKWSNLKHLTKEQAEAMRITTNGNIYSAPEYSFFRLGKGMRADGTDSLGYSALTGIRGLIEGNQADFWAIKRYVQGSADDIDILKNMIRDNIGEMQKRRHQYTDTDLYNMLIDFDRFSNTVSHEAPGSQMFLKQRYLEEMLDYLTDGGAGQKEALKMFGYRKATLGDIAELKGRSLVLKENAPFEAQDLLDRFNLMAMDPHARTKGEHIFKNGAWKEMPIDSRIRISEDGLKTVDYRMVVNDWINFLHSVANDFGLPMVKFNPFKSILGLDKVGTRSPFGAWISAGQLDPSITGMAVNATPDMSPAEIAAARKETTIGAWLRKTLGEDAFMTGNAQFDAVNGVSGVAVINGKAIAATYDPNTQRMNNLIELKDNLKLYDISYADKRITLPRALNAERQMAGLDIGSAQDWYKNWDQYEQSLKDQGIEVTPAMKYKHFVAHFLDLGHQEARADMASDGSIFESMGNMDEFISNIIKKVSETDALRVSAFEYKDVRAMYGETVADAITGAIEAGQNTGLRQFSYKSVFGQGPAEYMDETLHKVITPHMYYAQRRGHKINGLVQAAMNGDFGRAKEEAQHFLGQFFVGRQIGNDNLMSEYFTEWSGNGWSPWGIMNQLSEGIGSQMHQLGLSTYSKRNPAVMLGNLLAKRALPVYMLTQLPGMLNWLSEPFMGEDEKTGQPDNITRWFMRGPVRSFDIAAHRVLDFTNITQLFKKAETFVPGWDQIEGTIPGVHGLGLSQTPEEREDWIENGYNPVRKGRYWSVGNTPWTGTKIMYWRPNLYRRVEADVNFSASKWGSRQEYYSHTWYPNIVNPLAPLNYFVLDRNHYDKVHYLDRPYLQTSPVGQNIPIVGPIFSQTVGRVISPPVKMHPEYWRNGLKPLPEDEIKAPAISTGQVYHPSGISILFPYGSEQIRRLNQQVALSQELDAQGRYASQFAVAQHMRRGSVIDQAAVAADGLSILPKVSFDVSSYNLTPLNPLSGPPHLPVRTYDRYGGNPLDIYRTPSGGMSIVDVPDELNLYNVNEDLRKISINKIPGTNKRVDIVDTFSGPDIPVGNDVQQIDNQFVSVGLKGQYNTMTDVAGLKGFAIRQFVTGKAGVHDRVIEDSSYAYGMNKSFWDQNLGGLGSNLSEITRRFVPDRNKDMDYINPIRNTMPQWMPGSDYFTDFKHGDPYSKIMNGEERLPGEGYERLHNIDVMNMHIGASALGYSREDMVQKLIGQGSYRSTFNQDALDTGTKLHRMIEKSWMETGFAINVEQQIEDKRNNISGQYDALVNDPNSPTGVAMIDIKTTNRKKLNQIRLSGKPLEQHAKQLNYYMWATQNQNSNGYIYYVDKEHPENGYMAPMRFSPEMLQESLTNLYKAREDVRYAMKKGIIGRGDLYSPLDRMRILADVAPYSQEYADAAAAVSNMKLKPEQKEEAAAIRERVKEQKEPLRVYPYKFKTSNVQGEWVTVKAILDNNTILTREYGKEHAVKFAGIHVSESQSDLINKHKEKYTDARGVTRYRTVGTPLGKAANREIRKHVHPGMKVFIQYDADERNKYSKDSTRSIRAVVRGIRGENVNKILLEKGYATEKDDDSPAGIRARYTPGQIAFGSAMERITHGVVANIPFVGSKILQVQSPYEAYRRKEVYGKDFQSWNNPISGILLPSVQRHAGEHGPIMGVMLGGFIGSLFGKNRFGKMLGAFAGATTVIAGKGITSLMGRGNGREWVPNRRIQQENINEYVDMLKYVKNVRLYEQYKEKAKREDNFDVDAFMGSGKSKGIENQIRRRELEKYKRTLKLDFGNRRKFAFNTGAPKYASPDMSYKDSIKAINKEISELQSDRKVYKASANAMKAIYYKQAAQATMYGFEPGDSLVNIMSALPKKERQYFKHFMNAPEEEKQKILNIAPSYLRRALQASWGMKVDPKPSIDEYFSKHGLPDENWIGWREDADMNDVKVKIVHANRADYGEFDIWDDNRRKADQSNIPVPDINATNSRAEAQQRLIRLFGMAGYHDVQMRHGNSIRGDGFSLNVKYDAREDVEYEIEQAGW